MNAHHAFTEEAYAAAMAATAKPPKGWQAWNHTGQNPRKINHDLVIRLSDEGFDCNAIARRVGCTPKHVSAIRCAARKARTASEAKA